MKACVIVHVPVCNNSRIISNITKGKLDLEELNTIVDQLSLERN